MAIDQRLDRNVIDIINERIRNVFDHQAKTYKDSRLPVDVRYAKKENRKRQRMSSAVSVKAHNSNIKHLPFCLQKCAMGKKWFDTAPEH